MGTVVYTNDIMVANVWVFRYSKHFSASMQKDRPPNPFSDCQSVLLLIHSETTPFFCCIRQVSGFRKKFRFFLLKLFVCYNAAFVQFCKPLQRF